MADLGASTSYHASFGPTGFRRGFSEGEITPLDAPIKPRRYLFPSRTARRDLDDDPCDEEYSQPPHSRSQSPPEPQRRDQPSTAHLGRRIAEQRLKNTLSARRSRARKLETLETLRREKDDLQHSLKDKEVALEKALHERAYFRALTGNLNEQLAQKSAIVDELAEAKNRLTNELWEMRAERDRLLRQSGLRSSLGQGHGGVKPEPGEY